MGLFNGRTGGGGQVRVLDAWTAASQSAMLALAADRGDFALRTDTNVLYMLTSDDPTQLVNWTVFPLPVERVLDVALKTGHVTLVIGDIAGLQAALDAKLAIADLPRQLITVPATSDLSRSSTVTIADDTELLFAALANTVYIVEAGIDFVAGSGGSKVQIDGPSGATGALFASFISDAGSTVTFQKLVLGSPFQDGGVANARWMIRGIIRIGATPGNVVFRWAQGTSNATATVRKAGSSMAYRKIQP